MTAYILRRLAMTLPVIFGILLITFLMQAMVQSDAAQAQFVGQATEEQAAEAIAAIRAKYGLDLPWHERFLTYAGNVLHGDLGESIRTRQPVWNEIGYRFANTLILTIAALGVALVVGITTGIVAAYWRGRWIDEAAMSVGLLGISMPAFFLGLVMIFIFAVQLRWLPVITKGGWDGLMLPALTLGLIEAAALARITRGAMIGVLDQDYIKAARAKGTPEFVLVIRHALPNALLSILTILGLQIGGLLGGAFIIETIFGWHGIGELAVKSIESRDYPITQAIVLISALTYVAVNLVVDILYAWADPRISLE